uniref:DDE Tnp4 domain-containing protein n=1 Tax=Amphimedon queenslandica TaxID=400682 RepID=A0A1X7VF87_AMPQE
MLRPFSGKYVPDKKRIFNYRLSRARRIIENTFGIMVTKFRIFFRPIIAKPEKIVRVTQAACALHPYLKISEAQSPPSSGWYCLPGYIDLEDRHGNVTLGDWRQLDLIESGLCDVNHIGGNRFSKNAG